jgi:hypothetical protein
MGCADLWALGLFREVNLSYVRLNGFGVYPQDIPLGACILLSIGDRLGSAFLFVEHHIGNVFLYLFWLEQQPIANSRLSIFVYFHLLPALHLLEVDIREMRLNLPRIEDKVVAINVALRLFVSFDHVFLFLPVEVNGCEMGVDGFI